MKTRIGFVSNSSTSSFCIFGVAFETLQEVAQALKFEGQPEIEEGCDHQFDRATMKFCPECGTEAYYEPEEDDDEWLVMALEKECERHGLELNDKRYAEYGVYVGVGLYGKGDQLVEKLAQANRQIKELFGQDAETYCEAYYS